MNDSADRLAYVQKVNDLFYDQIKVADQKATYILTIIIFLLVWSPDVKRAFFWKQDAPQLSLTLALDLALAAALLTALGAALATIMPRRRTGGTLMFWGAWPEAKADAIEITKSGDSEALARAYVDNADNLAAICKAKFRFVSVAFIALITAIATHTALIALR